MSFKKFITNSRTKPWLLIISELVLSALLKIDHSLTLIGMLVVLLFWAILCHLFIEWLKFEDEFKEMEEKQNGFLNDWILFKSDFSKLQNVVLELSKSKSRTGKVLDKFAKSNNLVNLIETNLNDDLELDEQITNGNAKIQTDFHSFISSLKYQEFMASHFIINAKEKEVLQIPSYYFKYKIWSEFIDKAYRYFSVQLMDNKQAKEYLLDEDRMKFEISFLDHKTDGENKTQIEKIFIIKNSYFDSKSGKIKDFEMIKYLNEWKKEFAEKYQIIPIMVLKEDDAIGIFGKERKALTDIGIFGDVYGEQSINTKTEGKFYVDDLKINFYFDKTKTDQKVEYFKKLKARAKPLKDVL